MGLNIYSYAELAGKHGVSAVTLRGKDSIKATMNETRFAAAAAKQGMEQACSEAAATKEELSKASQREEKKQLKQENANLLRIYQRLAMLCHAQGKSMPQFLAEFEAQMKDEATTNIVAPIFRS